MKSSFLLPTLIAACAIVGCNHDSRAAYPDRSEETKAHADAVRLERDRRDQVIDQDLLQLKNALAFEESQVENKSVLERERITLDRDAVIQPHKARQEDARTSSAREIERITQDGNTKLATVSGVEASRITTDTDSQIAEVKRKMADEIAQHEVDITAANQAAAKRIAHVDAGELQEKSAILQRREAAERKARKDHLAVSADTATKLDQVGQESEKRTDAQRAASAASVKQDQDIVTKVRQGFARHGDQTSGVTVVSDQGVVVLSGAVPDERVRREVVTDASKISGVVRVEDHLAIH